jgi:hypothetical protein
MMRASMIGWVIVEVSNVNEGRTNKVLLSFFLTLKKLK